MRTIAALLFVGFAASAHAEQISATSPYVIDGDTLDLKGQRVRLRNVDAPELREPGGTEARDYLRRLVFSRAVICEGVARDRYKRMVATCAVDGRDLGEALIAAGVAKPHVRPAGQGAVKP